MSFYTKFGKPFLFQLDAENAHWLTMASLRLACQLPGGKRILQQLFQPSIKADFQTEVAGIQFKNPIGLAAGFDKNAEFTDELACLGFGSIEIGTVTPLPQVGNPRPRLFRMPADEALLNRMGFNNEGVDAVAKRLRKRKNREIIIGGNIGKNKITSNEEAWRDYLTCFRVLADEVDYFTINLSSPNTPGLRQLLEKEFLTPLLEPIQNENQKRNKPKPLFLKISPDIESEQLESILEALISLNMNGIVATNTTTNRNSLETSEEEIEQLGSGGISGLPLQKCSLEFLKEINSKTNGKLAIISSGGIMNPEEGKSRLQNGANLIQLYSGLVYYGPGLVGNCLNGLY